MRNIDKPNLAGLCAFDGCGDPVMRYPGRGWRHIEDPNSSRDVPLRRHRADPAPGSVMTADVWDCDEAAARQYPVEVAL